MTPDTDDGSQWDRVAAELRACRESQQRAWGDIDNTTLGRFLAGEVTSEEQQQIENALDALPELRKLTDLVRDVLGGSELAASKPVSVPYGPSVLPFPQSQQRTMRAATTSGRAEPTPSRERKAWQSASRWRQRASLAAAACLLLVLGITLPRTPGSTTPEPDPSLVLFAPAADSSPSFVANGVLGVQVGDAKNPVLSRKSVEGSNRFVEEQFQLTRMDASLQHLETQGKKREADLLARQYINNLTRQALLYQEKGDLEHAEPVLHEACQLCAKTFGPESPQTIRTRNSLAGVYEIALNSAPPLNSKRAVRSSAIPQALPPTTGDATQFVLSERPAASSAPIHSASGYAAPQASQMNLVGSRSGRQPRCAAPPLDRSSSNLELRERIIHRSPNEVKASVVRVLTQAFREAKNAGERQRFACALGHLGPAACDAAPLMLASCCRATDAGERATLLLTLARIAPKELRQTLETHLRAKDFEGGKQACLRFLANKPAK